MSVNWGEIPFLSVTELQKELSRLECPSQITEFLQALVQEDLFSSDRSRFVQEWLKWCRQQKNRVKVVEFDVPNSILPPKCHASLYDIKVILA